MLNLGSCWVNGIMEGVDAFLAQWQSSGFVNRRSGSDSPGGLRMGRRVGQEVIESSGY